MTQQPTKRVTAPLPVQRPSAATPKSGGSKNKKIANSLVALGSAAIISVYGLGYIRTDAAQAVFNLDAPAISIATVAPTVTATDVPSSPVAAYQSPLFPTPTAIPSVSGGSAQDVATATTAQTTANVTTTTPSVPATVAKAPATATSVPATTTIAPLPRATTAPAVATKAPATATTALYKDGTYAGTGTSRHGNITASVVVQGGKIVSAAITQCGTRYPCSDVAALPGEVVARQSATVDFVSGATDSSQAYQGAIQNALAKAKGAA